MAQELSKKLNAFLIASEYGFLVLNQQDYISNFKVIDCKYWFEIEFIINVELNDENKLLFEDLDDIFCMLTFNGQKGTINGYRPEFQFKEL
jgi:hypothetical protein